jgi:hypothetical protein
VTDHGRQKEVFDALRDADVRQIAFVPDAGHSHVIREAIGSPDIQDVVLTTERTRARSGPAFAQVLIGTDEPPRALPPRDGVFVKNRFRAALGLPTF